MKIAKKYNLKIIEDCAQSFGAKFNKFVGTFGEVGCFSLHPLKSLGQEETEVLLTKNKKLYEKF